MTNDKVAIPTRVCAYCAAVPARNLIRVLNKSGVLLQGIPERLEI